MKKLLTIILVLGISSTLFAQQGSMYVGGALGFGNDSWKVAPEVGTWLADDLQLGVVLTFAGSDVNSEKSRVAPHLYLRKWWSVSEKFSVYLGANARYVSVKDQNDDTQSTFDAFVDAGLAYAVAERWGIVGRIAAVGQINDDFTLDFNMSPQSLFNVGIYYTFKQ